MTELNCQGAQKCYHVVHACEAFAEGATEQAALTAASYWVPIIGWSVMLGSWEQLPTESNDDDALNVDSACMPG